MSPRRAGALPLLLRLDPDAQQPLNQQIYQGLRAAILDGRLRGGTRFSTELPDDILRARPPSARPPQKQGPRNISERAQRIADVPIRLRTLTTPRLQGASSTVMFTGYDTAFRIGACALDEFPR